MFGGSITAYLDGSGVLADLGTFIGRSNQADKNSPVDIVRYNATSLATVDTILVLKPLGDTEEDPELDVEVRGIKIMPQPRKA